MQYRLLTGCVQLVYHAHARGAAIRGGAVEVASRVADHTCVRAAAVLPAGEAVQHCIIAGRIQLVPPAPVRCAARRSCPVEVSGRVADHTSVGVAPVGPARETVQHCLLAASIGLEHDSRARCAAMVSGSGEVSGRVADHTCKGEAPVGPARKAVEHVSWPVVFTLYNTPEFDAPPAVVVP